MLKRILLNNLSLTDINPQVCGIHACQPGEITPRHHIQRRVLHYVTQGSGQYLVNDREYTICADEIFISLPGSVTSYISSNTDPLSYIWVSFDCTEAFDALLKQEVLQGSWSRSVFERILDCSNSAAPEWTVCSCLFDFFAQLAQRMPAAAAPRDDYVSRAVNYIQTNFADRIQVAEIAADLGLSRNYFCRIFKQQTTLSPQAYLVSCRLNAAARLLVEQGLSQKEAALQVGYSDVCSFSRMFKRKSGVSPGAYVKRQQEAPFPVMPEHI